MPGTGIPPDTGGPVKGDPTACILGDAGLVGAITTGLVGP
ncbi:unnamed protein product, partial [marine sediment metagenome]